MRDLAYKAIQAKEQLTVSLGKEPTIEQIAEAVGEEKSEVVLAMESISDPVSLYEPLYSDSGDTMYLMDQIGDGSEADDWMNEMLIRDAIADLTPRERNILHRRFMMGRTQVEVAAEIGISQAQVSRLEKGAIEKIKAQL